LKTIYVYCIECLLMWSNKKHLKIPNSNSEVVNRKTDNTMVKIKMPRTIWQNNCMYTLRRNIQITANNPKYSIHEQNYCTTSNICPFPFGHCIVWSPSIYGFWLYQWYLQIVLGILILTIVLSVFRFTTSEFEFGIFRRRSYNTMAKRKRTNITSGTIILLMNWIFGVICSYLNIST
jgi:hypothetical protein